MDNGWVFTLHILFCTHHLITFASDCVDLPSGEDNNRLTNKLGRAIWGEGDSEIKGEGETNSGPWGFLSQSHYQSVRHTSNQNQRPKSPNDGAIDRRSHIHKCV